MLPQHLVVIKVQAVPVAAIIVIATITPPLHHHITDHLTKIEVTIEVVTEVIEENVTMLACSAKSETSLDKLVVAVPQARIRWPKNTQVLVWQILVPAWRGVSSTSKSIIWFV